MRSRIWLMLAIAAFALLLGSAPVFRDSSHGSPTAVFSTLLQQRYPGWTGYRSCAPGPLAGHDLCWAEIHENDRYRHVEIGMDVTTASPVPTAATPHDFWTRHPIAVTNAGGSGVANTNAYDWELLMTTIPPSRLPASFLVVGGDTAGAPEPIFRFACSGTPARIACHNALGDRIVYTPTSKISEQSPQAPCSTTSCTATR